MIIFRWIMHTDQANLLYSTMTFSFWGEASEWCDDDDVWQLQTIVCPMFDVHEMYVFGCEVFLLRPNVVTLTIQSFRCIGPVPLPMFNVEAILIINNETPATFTINNISHVRFMPIFEVDNFENIESVEVHVTLRNVH